MNKVIEVGRLTRDPEVRYTSGDNAMCIARFSIAVPRTRKKDGADETDFFNCVAFGKTGEFIEKYMHKGNKVIIEGRLQSGSYTNKDGQKVNTVDIVVENIEFGESKNSSGNAGNTDTSNKSASTSSKKNKAPESTPEDFDLTELDGLDEELPFI